MESSGSKLSPQAARTDSHEYSEGYGRRLLAYDVCTLNTVNPSGHRMTDDLEQLTEDLETVEDLPVFIAYNANIDAVLRVGARLDAYLDPPTNPGTEPPPRILESKRDLAAAITHTMAAGRGDEVAMADSLARMLEAELDPDAEQMGGQAGIMTNLLTSLHASPITYTYLVSERQRSMFDSPDAVRYPIVDGEHVRYVPLSEFTNADKTKMNWVFEFRRGDTLFGVEAIEDTRFIAASRPPEFNLIAGDLDERIDQVGEVVDGALLAGYHNLTRENVDESYEHTQRHGREFIRRLRTGGDVTVHIEYAVTHDEELRRSMYDWILPEADAVSADTHEIGLMFGDASFTVSDSIPREDTAFEAREILTHYEMLSALRQGLGVDCIRLHAMEYHLVVHDAYLPPNAILRGLAFAAVNAATKASLGRITGPEDLREGLTYPPSDAGRGAIELLADQLEESTADGTLATPHVVACPNRVVRDPARTVGIGDIVSASSFVVEVAAGKEQEAKAEPGSER